MSYRSAVEQDLTQIERGEALAHLQRAQRVHGFRALIAFDGWEASGKTRALQRLSSHWNPCHFSAHSVLPIDDRHWLARYWCTVPAAGRTTLFCGSWHREIVVARLSGQLTDADFARRCDEINEFEAQQRDAGCAVIKLFFDVSATIQADRLAAIEADPWTSRLRSADRPRDRDAEQAAWSDLFARTDTRWAPWTLIDANDMVKSEEASLAAVTETLERLVPRNPPREKVQRAVG